MSFAITAAVVGAVAVATGAGVSVYSAATAPGNKTTGGATITAGSQLTTDENSLANNETQLASLNAAKNPSQTQIASLQQTIANQKLTVAAEATQTNVAGGGGGFSSQLQSILGNLGVNVQPSTTPSTANPGTATVTTPAGSSTGISSTLQSLLLPLLLVATAWFIYKHFFKKK